MAFCIDAVACSGMVFVFEFVQVSSFISSGLDSTLRSVVEREQTLFCRGLFCSSLRGLFCVHFEKKYGVVCECEALVVPCGLPLEWTGLDYRKRRRSGWSELPWTWATKQASNASQHEKWLNMSDPLLFQFFFNPYSIIWCVECRALTWGNFLASLSSLNQVALERDSAPADVPKRAAGFSRDRGGRRSVYIS